MFPVDLSDAAAHFSPSRPYLDTATAGLPPTDAVTALAQDLERWRAGRIDARGYDRVVARSRTAYARLVDVPADRVGIISQASVGMAVAAGALGRGDRVVVAEEDFTSVLFPFLQAAQRGVEVVAVPLDRLLDAVDPSIAMVAVSAVQSADGRVLDLDALDAVATANRCLTAVDLTQAAGWLDVAAHRFTVTTCAAYKWLCSPRGAGFVTVDPAMAERLPPVAPGWYAGEDVWTSIYRPPLRLAGDGRRHDLSPAWAAWVGAAPALELLADVGVAAIGAHDVALVDRLCDGLGIPRAGSAIASVDRPGAVEALRAADIACAGRDGRLRLSCHLYSSAADVDRVLDVLTG